jgi:hypothetical protein
VPAIIFQLGVHKTATTHLQTRLYNTKSILELYGVGYAGLEETRRVLTKNIAKGLYSKGEIDALLDDYKKVIIFDENILGDTNKPKNNQLYPRGIVRFKKLLDFLNPEYFDIHITIRNPEDYLVSRYSEFLRHYKFLPVSHYFDEYALTEFSWVPLIRNLEKVAGKSVKVTTFESLVANDTDYLQMLTGLDIDFAAASAGPDIRRSKISRESYDLIQQFSRHFPKEAMKDFIKVIDNNNQVTVCSDIKPFSYGLSNVLAERYRKDKYMLGLGDVT